MHAKLVVVDEREAFVIGSPFSQKFWDWPEHNEEEPRRNTRVPQHDLALRLEGPAVASVSEFFARAWNARVEAEGAREMKLDTAAARRLAPATAGRTALQVTTTTPPGALGDRHRGRSTILESYLRAIASARRFIYIENQYFTNPTIARALSTALEARGALEVILLLNTHVDIPTYDRWQEKRLRELGPHARLGVFHLALPPKTAGATVTPVYVHTKLAIADDAWMTVGSANLDSLSLEEAREWGIPVQSNVELNVVILDGIAGAPRTGVVERTRARLWAEHLSLAEDAVAREGAATFLDLWREAAEANAEALRRGEPPESRVLPHAARGAVARKTP